MCIRDRLQATDQTSQAQRGAIESLAASATAVLDKANDHFAQLLGTQSSTAAELAAHVNASAIELSSLGASFHLAVKLFSESNHELINGLQRIEGAVTLSLIHI